MLHGLLERGQAFLGPRPDPVPDGIAHQGPQQRTGVAGHGRQFPDRDGEHDQLGPAAAVPRVPSESGVRPVDRTRGVAGVHGPAEAFVQQHVGFVERQAGEQRDIAEVGRHILAQITQHLPQPSDRVGRPHAGGYRHRDDGAEERLPDADPRVRVGPPLPTKITTSAVTAVIGLIASFEDRDEQAQQDQATIVTATSHRGALGSIANARCPGGCPATVPAIRNSDRPSAP